MWLDLDILIIHSERSLLLIVKAAVVRASAVVLEEWEWTDDRPDECDVHRQVHVLVEVPPRADHQQVDSRRRRRVWLWGHLPDVDKSSGDVECRGSADCAWSVLALHCRLWH